MNAKERLGAVQLALEQRGVKDVKFFFSNTSEKPVSQVASDVAGVLQAYLDGKVTPIEKFNDLPA